MAGGIIAALVALAACEGSSSTRQMSRGPSNGGDAGAGGTGGGRAGQGGSNRGGTGSGATSTGGSPDGGAPDGTGGSPGGEGGEGGAGETGGAAGATSAGAGGAGAAGLAGAGTGGASGGAGVSGSGGGPCGGPDEPCCLPQVCNAPGTECVRMLSPVETTRCVPCGVPGAPCCTGPTVGNHVPRRCDGGCCVRQGSPADWRCIAPGDTCPVGGACQNDGSCTDCGGIGKACCDQRPAGSIWCTDPSGTCVTDDGPPTCHACGNLDERCCVNTEEAFPTSRCAAGLECEAKSRVCR